MAYWSSEYFRSLFARREEKSVSLSDPIALELFGAVPSSSNVSITPASAIRVPAVYSAIALITGAIGSLPAKVFASTDSGKRTAKDHPAYRLVHDEANEWTSAGKLREKLTADALLFGHGFAHVGRNAEGRAVEIIRLDPRTVSIKEAPSGEPFYVQRLDGRDFIYGFADIIHISAPLDTAPIKAGREAIGLATILERNAASLFANGARPSGVISKKDPAGPTGDGGGNVVTNMRKAWRNFIGNADRDPMFLDAGWEYQSITMTSTDAQFHEMRRFETEEIARLFRVPPSMLFDLTNATLNNAEEMGQQFLTLTLRYWLDQWEAAYARCLFTPEERLAGFYVEFVTDDLLSADAATRATTFQQYRAMGVLTANEVRAALNKEALPGGDKLENPNITPGKPASSNDNADAGKDAA